MEWFPSLVFILLVNSIRCDGTKQATSLLTDRGCPTWQYLEDGHNETVCKCGSTLGGVVWCYSNENTNWTRLQLRYCMTYDSTSTMTLVGSCPFSNSIPESHIVDRVYVNLPRNVSELNSFTCGVLNRVGTLCGQCKPGLGPAVLSYKLPCVECPHAPYGLLLYLFLAFFPTTVLFLLVVIFQVRATFPPLNIIAFGSQVAVLPMSIHPHILLYGGTTTSNYLLLSIYGIWNLDFFRDILPAFCISDKLTNMHTLSLDYLVAFYPLVLIVLTYILIELHARDCKLVVCIWRPFNVCFARWRRRWDPKASIVHAFATFLLLSYTKILFVSYNFLGYAQTYNSSGDEGPKLLYFDASVQYFSHKHLPFAILAVFVLFTFVFLPPLFLCLYPTRMFQRCLGYCRIRWHALHAFAAAFNGCYKDGTNGTRDYRYFGGFYLVLCNVFIIVAIVTSGTKYAWMSHALWALFASLFLALSQPYKESLFNFFDGSLLAFLAVAMLAIVQNIYISSVPNEVVYAIFMLPLFYLILFVVCRIALHTNLRHRKLGAVMERFTAYHTACEQECHEEEQDVPDRLINPEEYRDLLSVNDATGKGDTPFHTDSIPTYGAL